MAYSTETNNAILDFFSRAQTRIADNASYDAIYIFEGDDDINKFTKNLQESQDLDDAIFAIDNQYNDWGEKMVVEALEYYDIKYKLQNIPYIARDEYNFNVIITTGSDGTGGAVPIEAIYDTTLSNSIAMQEEHGGLAAGTTVADLKNDTITSILDRILFEPVDPFINIPVSLQLVDDVPSSVEVGTLMEPQLTGLFISGIISNGDMTIAGPLLGPPSQYAFSGPGISGTAIVLSTIYSEHYTPTPSNAVLGTNVWSLTVTYDAGTGIYTDSHGNPSNVLDAARVSGTISINSGITNGRLAGFYGQGQTASNSAEARALTKVLLDGNNTFTMTIPPGETEATLAVPNGWDVTIIDLDALNANVTGDYDVTSFNVNDAAGTARPYEVYTLPSEFAGYGTSHRHQITVTN